MSAHAELISKYRRWLDEAREAKDRRLVMDFTKKLRALARICLTTN